MDIAIFHSLWTVVLLIVFVGIVAWAFWPTRKRDFDAAARIPIEDDDHG